MRKELQKLFDIIKQPAAEVENQSRAIRCDHIFLKDVEIYTAFGKVKASHWVGKINSVDGFVLGQYMSYPKKTRNYSKLKAYPLHSELRILD